MIWTMRKKLDEKLKNWQKLLSEIFCDMVVEPLEKLNELLPKLCEPLNPELELVLVLVTVLVVCAVSGPVSKADIAIPKIN